MCGTPAMSSSDVITQAGDSQGPIVTSKQNVPPTNRVQQLYGCAPEWPERACSATDVVQKSYTEKAEEELDKIAIESSEESMEEDAVKVPVNRKRMMIAAGAVTAVVFCLVLSRTAFGTWLANECMVISTLIQKVSALASGVMDKIPWPAPEHGAESIWQTITILFASVLVCSENLALTSCAIACPDTQVMDG
jgi:hypothetical protein